jgi:antitoxin (DNA-binding transcriptional repressor) of toxin-antitoxin stability system
MKTVEISEVSLADYGGKEGEEPLVLTRRGRPVAAVVPIGPGVDLESFALSHDPEFIEIINRSWKGYQKTGGISLEELREAHGPVAHSGSGPRRSRSSPR